LLAIHFIGSPLLSGRLLLSGSLLSGLLLTLLGRLLTLLGRLLMLLGRLLMLLRTLLLGLKCRSGGQKDAQDDHRTAGGEKDSLHGRCSELEGGRPVPGELLPHSSRFLHQNAQMCWPRPQTAMVTSPRHEDSTPCQAITVPTVARRNALCNASAFLDHRSFTMANFVR
jgi:hypothetical protein